MKPLPRVAWVLGYAGLLPFLILTLALVFDFSLPFLQGVHLAWWLVAYAAIILSFLGAVHWGVVLGLQHRFYGKEIRQRLFYGVLPAILAWFVLLLPVKYALWVMGVLLLLTYAADHILLFNHLKSRYEHLRLHLTLAATLLMFIAGIVAS